jgi:hypothetical protein
MPRRSATTSAKLSNQAARFQANRAFALEQEAFRLVQERQAPADKVAAVMAAWDRHLISIDQARQMLGLKSSH